MRFQVQLLLLLGGVLLAGCAGEYQAFDEAKAANTAEAYQAFLDEYPDSVNKAAAVERLDNLDWEATEAENSAAAYEAYLAKYPEGRHVTDAQLAAPKLAWQDADFSCDPAKVKEFLDKYSNSAYASKAQQRLELLELIPNHLEVGPAILVEGDKKKWTVSADVKNVGDLDVITAEFRVAWSNADGRVTRTKDWYLVVAPNERYDSAESLGVPLAPGETRTFSFDFRRSEAAEDWVEDAEHIRVGLIDLAVGTTASPAPAPAG